MPDPYPMTNYSKEDSRRSDTSLRVLPQNPDAEASVLAACLLSPDAIEEAATKLRPARLPGQKPRNHSRIRAKGWNCRVSFLFSRSWGFSLFKT